MNLPTQIRIREVGPRDGLQAEHAQVTAEEKAELINRLYACKLTMIEATSFVNPRAIPQLADAEAVIAMVHKPPMATMSALIGNARGAERAAKAGVDEVMMVISASEAHNQRNVNMSIKESMRQMSQTIEFLRTTKLKARAAVATAFGCPLEGVIPGTRIRAMIKAYNELGVKEITLADTAGLGNPRQVYDLVSMVRDEFPANLFALHFHDTRGLGLANSLAGMLGGIEIFESALGGLGGCPFMPGATGNIATEDLVNMSEQMGISTGVDLPGLVAVSSWLKMIVGHELPGRLVSLREQANICSG